MVSPLLRIVDNTLPQKRVLPDIPPAPGFGDKAVTHGTVRTYLSSAKQVRVWSRKTFHCNHLLPHQGTAEKLLSQYIHLRMGSTGNPIKEQTAKTHLSAMAWRYRVYVRRLARWCGYQDGLNPVGKAHHDLVEQWAIRQAESMTMSRGGKHPITASELIAMTDQCPDTLPGLRDKALLLLGFCGGIRRSELVSLQADDITISPESVRVLIRKSKTDRTGKGTTKFIMRQTEGSVCPVVAVGEWLKASGLKGGALFRSFRKGERMQESGLPAQSVAKIVKQRGREAGIPENRIAQLSAHSLRSGMATEARMKGHSTLNIQQQGGWSSPDMPGHYTRHADMTKPENNASHRILERTPDFFANEPNREPDL